MLILGLAFFISAWSVPEMQKMLELKKITQNANVNTNKMTRTWKEEYQNGTNDSE